MSVNRIAVTAKMPDDAGQQAFDELKRGVESRFLYGTAAPTAAEGFEGSVYYKIGSATTDAVTVYIKIGGSWYGG